MQFLKHSQDPVMAEKDGARGGVGLAAPQLDISIIAVLSANIVEEGETPGSLRFTSQYVYPSVSLCSDAALGEGRLSVC